MFAATVLAALLASTPPCITEHERTTSESRPAEIELVRGAASASRVAGLNVWVVKTPHYELFVHGEDATFAYELGEFTERAYEELCRFFADEPKLAKGKKLVGYVLPDRATFLQSLEPVPEWLNDETISLSDPASGEFTLVCFDLGGGNRYMYLDRVAHQFHHHLGAGHADFLGNSWYAEGLVGHLAEHWWDGKVLRLAVEPLFDHTTQREEVVKRLRDVGPPPFDLAGFLAAHNAPHRPLGRALVAWIARVDERGARTRNFRSFAEDAKKSRKLLDLFERWFSKAPTASKALAEWLEEHPETFNITAGWFEMLGEKSVRGYSDSLAMCRTVRPCLELRATVDLAKLRGPRAGVVLGEDGPANAVIASVDATGRVYVERIENGRRSLLESEGVKVEPSGRAAFLLRREGDMVNVVVGSESVGTFATIGERFGLFVEGVADFTAIETVPLVQ